MSCAPISYTREFGEDIVIGYVDSTATSERAANVTGKIAELPPGTLKLTNSAIAAATFVTSYRAPVGTEGAEGYIAGGYDFTLAAADYPVGIEPGRYLFDYTDTSDGKYTSDPSFLVLRKAASA